ncbi:MAG: hypothetical protein CMK07_10635 [Ponticaulis sp.]|nr:hypothetical protein [Ponticaulis sp.]
MFRKVCVALGVFGLSLPGAAQSLSNDQIVELYGQADQAWGAEISPDGKNLAMGCAPLGPPAVCIYEIGGAGKPQLFQVPDQTRLNTFYWISPKHLLISVNIFDTVRTSGGLRDYRFDRLISYNVETANSEVLARSEARYITNGNVILASLPDDDDTVLMPLGGGTLWKVDLNSGDARKDRTYNSGLYDYIILQPDGTEAAYEKWDSNTGKYTLRDGDKDVLLETVNKDNWPYDVYGFNQDRTALLAWADTDTEFGLRQISLSDGSVSDVVIDGMTVGAVGRILDEISQELIGVGYTNDVYEQLFIEPTLKNWHDELKTVFPGQNVLITSWTRDKSIMTVSVASEGKPADYYLFETNGPAVSPLAQSAPQFAERTLGSVEAVTYDAADGLEIEGYLTLPPGKTQSDGPFPLVLLPHGGPEARDTASFDWWAQSYAAAGYAVLQPNFRGSSGYGQEFRNAGYGEFGGKMITDSLDGANWLVEEGVAAPGGFCIIGASYGGYAALQGAILGGDDVKCAVSVNGVTDPISEIRGASSDGGAFRYWEDYMGVTRFSSDEDERAISPRQRIGEINAAILLIHGREDTTVKFNQSEYMAELLSNRSNARFVPMSGEDHYLRSRDARQTVLSESLAWLDQYLPVE